MQQYPHQLSGGMRQRVAIAMALICRPEILIADEPTTALDVTVQAQVLSLLREIRERFGTAVILVTHDLGVIAELADRVNVMYAGRIVETGSVDDIFYRCRHPYTEALERSIPQLTEDPARAPDGDRGQSAESAAPAAGLRVCSALSVSPGHVRQERAAARNRRRRTTPRRASTKARSDTPTELPGMSEPILSVRDLRVYFEVPRRRMVRRAARCLRAVDGVSFDLARRRDAGSRRRVGLRQIHAGARGAGTWCL